MAEYGAVELVLCTYDGIIEGKGGNRQIQYTWIGGKKDTHQWSVDKNKYAHCYDKLEDGCNYLIWTKHVGSKRWVWIHAILMTKKELKLVMDEIGVTPTKQELDDILEVIKEMRRYKKPAPSIEESAAATLIF